MTEKHVLGKQKHTVRPFHTRDVKPVEALIDATGLFPSQLLGPMVAPFLAETSTEERWAVVDLDGPIGVAYWVPERMTSGTWNLLLIAVHPSYQRQGVGAALVEYVEQQLKLSGQRILLVETSGLEEFQGTRAFYSNCGYAAEARVRDFYNAGEDKVVFRKDLHAKLSAAKSENHFENDRTLHMGEEKTNITDVNKKLLQDFIEVVWNGRDLSALSEFWTEDCLNHAMPGTDNRGLMALRAYHDSFFYDFFNAFPDIRIEIKRQLGEGDRIATYITSQGTHTGSFYGIAATGKHVSTSVIRIDRFVDGKIAEHWSVSDGASLTNQIQS